MSDWQPSSGIVLQTRDGYVADRLREAILRGQLKPGQKLDQNELAELLNVSRSPVREALRTLAAEGLVEVYPHRGAVVAELSPEEFEEISIIRVVLEGMAARLAAPHIDDERIALLTDVLAELENTTDLDRWVELNRRFHITIYQAVHRPRLLSFIENLRITMTPYIRQYIASDEHLNAARIGHRRILEACINRDENRAQEETERHLKDVYEEALKYLAANKLEI
jgi:DNA-binding GntR family transcriptional regulator